MDNFRRQIFLKYELKHILNKSIMKNESTYYASRLWARYDKTHCIRAASRIQQNNRCVISGRVFNVLKQTRYSRFVFRTESYIGNMPACRKASW